MAKQTGIVKIKGTIGDFTFAETRNGHIARKKTSFDGKRINREERFVRTRENNQEFSTSIGASKLLRTAVNTLSFRINDNRASTRLTQVMSVVKNLDGTSRRGERKVTEGLKTKEGRDALKKFNFNIFAELKATIKRPLIVNPSTGEITMKNFVGLSEVNAPFNSTHVILKGVWVRCDFETGEYELSETNEESIPLDLTGQDLLLSPNNPPSGTGNDIFLIKVSFRQLINGYSYDFKENIVLSIIEVL